MKRHFTHVSSLIIGLGSLMIILTPLVSANRAGGVSGEVDSSCEDIQGDCQALETLNSILNYMAIIIFPIVVIMIIVAGIQYSAGRDNPEAIASARSRIYKAVLALISLICLWTFLKWLIPGDILGG